MKTSIAPEAPRKTILSVCSRMSAKSTTWLPTVVTTLRDKIALLLERMAMKSQPKTMNEMRRSSLLLRHHA